jgi:hypothetical protein
MKMEVTGSSETPISTTLKGATLAKLVLLYPEDGGNTFLQELVHFYKITRFLMPEVSNLHSHRRENLKPHTQSSVALLNRAVGQNSSAGIATRYALDSAEIESRWRRDFPHTSRPALGTTQFPINGHRFSFQG